MHAQLVLSTLAAQQSGSAFAFLKQASQALPRMLTWAM